jgi:RHS repeat-associated protein
VRGQLVELKDSLFGTCHLAYDLTGRQSEQLFPNGVRQEFTYTASDEIARVVTRGPDGAVLTARRYTYDPTGEITRAETLGRDWEAYAYDSEYHLLDAVHAEGEVESFRYDLDENLVHTAALGGLQYDGPRLRTAGPLEYVYDASGRVVTRSIGQSSTQFSYGLRGLIRTVMLPDGSVVDYEYDGFGRRVLKRCAQETVNYYWDGDVLLAEKRVTQAGATTVSYLYLPGTVRPLGHAVAHTVYFYDLDQRSVIREVYDSQGQEAARYRYRAFGERQVLSLRDEEADPPFRLLGQTQDTETGLYYNRFRYYDPVVGRYITPDPYLQDVEHNSYAYGPNPIRWADPLGLMADFSQAFLDKLLAANKAANGGMYKCENCGFTNSNKVYAVAPKSGRPVGDGSFHGDHFPVCNADGGDESTGGRVLGGVCNCSRGKGRPIKMT